METTTLTTTLTMTTTPQCQLIPVPKEAAMNPTTTAPADLEAAAVTVQHAPLWLVTDPHTDAEATWLVIAWERRGDLLAARVVPEDADMTTLETWPLFIQDTDLIKTLPDTWSPEAPPVSWAMTTDGHQDAGAVFWCISGWTWSGGRLEPVTTMYDAEELEREGLGIPLWSCKDTDGDRLEGYPVGWRWENGQLIPECSVENAESLDFWDSIIRSETHIER